MRTLTTSCCISGGGPAGIMLGYLLARSGIDVTVLEKWPDFFRDFRGDTIHPSTMQVLKELGLFEKFLTLPHNETKQVAVHWGSEEVIVADFTHLKSGPPFLGFIPQWDFLNFIAAEGKQYPGFHLLMETECTDLLWKEGRVVGIKAKDKEGELEIHAPLTIGADGRHSTAREKSGLTLKDFGAPIDVLWFEIPREDDGTARSLGYIDQGEMIVLIDRDTYWQCAFIIQKGDFESVKSRGIEAFRQSITKLVPNLTSNVEKITSWEQVKFLSVTVDYLPKWYMPGFICIGDSAHAMSPVGGVGINLAVQDAVAAANVLVPAFERPSGIQESDLQAIQTRRSRPAEVTQKAQVYAHTHVIARILKTPQQLHLPWPLRMIKRFPYLRRFPAYAVGIGYRPEHIRTKKA